MADEVDAAVNGDDGDRAVMRNWKYEDELAGDVEDCSRRKWCRGPKSSKRCSVCWKVATGRLDPVEVDTIPDALACELAATQAASPASGESKQPATDGGDPYAASNFM